MGILAKLLRREPPPFRLDWLQIEVSARCNRSCSYCPAGACAEHKHGGLMDERTFECLQPNFRDTGLVFLQGWGEPLLHPRFWEMARQAKAAGARAGFTTNATLLDETQLGELIGSGVDIMAVSLAGATESTQARFRPGCELARTGEALARLQELKRRGGRAVPQVHIAFMLLRSNWREVEALPALAADWGAAQVVVSNLAWTAGAEAERESMFAHPKLWPEAAMALERARDDAARRGIQLHYSLPGDGRPRAVCAENVLRSCFVTWEGDVTPCVFTSPGAPAGAEALVFGNVRRQTLAEIWNSERARAFRGSFEKRMALDDPRDSVPPEPCAHCRKLCEV